MKTEPKIFTFFPPPKYLTPEASGLAISEEAVRMVEFTESRGTKVLSRYTEKKLPRGMLSGGEVSDKDALTEVLQSFRDEWGVTSARVSVPERKTYIVQMDIPLVKDSEIREVVAIHLEEYVPLKLAEAVFDYQVLRVKGRACDTLELQVSAIHKGVVDSYLELFSQVGITLLSLEIEAQAVARAVVPDRDTHSFMVIDLGMTRTGVYMIAGGLVEFTTSLDIGGNTLEELYKNTFEEDLSREVMEKMKEDFRERGRGGEVDMDQHSALFMSFLSMVSEEVGRHLKYWQSHKNGRNETGHVDEVILTGSESNIEGLPQYLAEKLAVPVSFARVWQNIFDFDRYVPEISQKESLRYSSAIGLALILNTKE